MSLTASTHSSMLSSDPTTAILQQEAPILSLPYDVLLDILLLVRDSHSGHERIRFCYDATTVASFWRQTLFSTPMWWADLEFVYPCNLSFIRNHLTRGKASRLRLHITLSHIPSDQLQRQNDVDSNALTDAIMPHLHRCWFFSFEGETTDEGALYLTKSIIRIAQIHGMPQLRHFTYSILWGTNDKSDLTSLFPQWPLLKVLRLGGTILKYLREPLPQITRLHLSRGEDRERITFVHLGQILQSCPSLTLLALYDDILAHYSEVMDTQVTHTTLKSIFILGNMLHASELLVYVDAPNLHELVIAPVVAGDFRRLADLNLSACQKKFSSLKKLTLAPAYRHAILRCQKASIYFPSVETVIFANIYPIQFKKMFVRTPDVFPELQHLAVTSVDEGFVSIILSVAEMRKTQGSTAELKTLSVDTESYGKIREVVEENKSRFEALGLSVVSADLWGEQRMEAMFSDNKALFIGRHEEDIDSDVNTDE